MRLLVLGGTGFVGRAMAEEGVRRGDEVTVFNRGLRDAIPGAVSLTGDRLADGGLAALDKGEWDAVVDTWSAQGEAVGRTAELLRGRAGLYAYVSSRSVYRWAAVEVLTEDAPLADADDPGYAGDKLRAELATASFGAPVLLARAGLILGRYEDVGRLPWWLNRLAAGGPTLAPGPPGMRCRPVRETVEDTWAWLSSIGGAAPMRTDRSRAGLDPAVEASILG